MSDSKLTPLSESELAAETGTALPSKEVLSLLDLNVDLDLALDLAAPIDLAVAANANIAAPIDAAVGANVLSVGSTAQALADQGVVINQELDADAVANSTQDSVIDQGAGQQVPAEDVAETVAADPTDPMAVLDGDLLNVDVNVAADLNLSAPINGAVALNANVAAPIDAAVSANIGSVDSSATAVAQQDAIINQHLEGRAEANADQQSDIRQ
jgi:hypothetical protein